jgi:acetoin utilization deacetylase AcuC-like enzyme
MTVIYTRDHSKHRPAYEFVGKRREMVAHREVPDRIEEILRALELREMGTVTTPLRHPEEALLSVHGVGLVGFLKTGWSQWVARTGGFHPLIPDIFLIEGSRGNAGEPALQGGKYCFDAQTPLDEQTWEAALSAAGCALTAAERLRHRRQESVYVLCRPPGHHAGRNFYGGYCYLNNAALAAAHLQRDGSVAVLDIDYHHGNGTQDIFYDSDQVLVVSLHGDPRAAFPYYWGYPDEVGTKAGVGFNHNVPLPAGAGEKQYLPALEEALATIGDFKPAYLVLSLGMDTFSEDPLGGFSLAIGSFSKIGGLIASLEIPTVVIQEGGYHAMTIGECAAAFWEGFLTV